MPTIFFYGPELDRDSKREMIETFTETASRLTGKPKAGIVVYLMPSTDEEVGVGGKLLADRPSSTS